MALCMETSVYIYIYMFMSDTVPLGTSGMFLMLARSAVCHSGIFFKETTGELPTSGFVITRIWFVTGFHFMLFAPFPTTFLARYLLSR